MNQVLLRLKRFVILFLMFSMLITSSAWAQEPGKLVVVLMDSLRLKELAKKELPNFQKLLTEGGLSLLNTGTGGRPTPENTHTTIAAGSRALGSGWAGKAFHYEELTQEVFKQDYLTPEQLQTSLGLQPAAPQEIVNVGIYQLQEYNSGLKYKVEIGALGSLLRESGIPTYILGNRDTYSQPKRYAAMLTLDKQGSAGRGQVDREVLTVDEEFPYGMRTDYDKLLQLFQEALTSARFVVVETGDLARLEDYKEVLSSGKYQATRVNTLKRLDEFLGKLLAHIDPQKDLLILVSPTPHGEEAANHNTLTPLIFFGRDVQPGILTSASTKREGIVTNTDLAPTIAHFFGLHPPASFIGRAIYSIPAPAPLESLMELNARLVDNYHNRPVVLKTYVVMQIIFILSACALLFWKKRPFLTKGFNFFIFYFLVSTYLLILYRLFQTGRPYLSLAIFIALGLVLTAVVYLLPYKGEKKIWALAFITSATLLADLTLGQQFIQNSPLGYDPIAGARFYGLGNELAGVLLGSALLTSSLFLGSPFPWVRLGGVVYLAGTAFIVFSPQYGADVGGLISSTLSFGYLLLSLRQKKLPAKLLVLPAATVLLLAVVMSFDYFYNQDNFTHIGLTVSTIKAGGLEEVFNIISRKASMNWKLLNYSIWSKVLICFILALALLLAWPRGFILRFKSQNPTLFQTFVAILLASVVGLMVNDSGIIQAATTFIYLIYPLLYLAWNEKKTETSAEH